MSHGHIYDGMTRNPVPTVQGASLQGEVDAALYQQIAHHLPGGAVFVVNHALVYLFADGEALSGVGMTSADLEGKTVREVVGPEMANQAESDYRLVLQGHSFEREHAVREQVFLSRGTPLRNSHGEVQAALVISYDITQRVQAEQVFKEANIHKDEFLAMLVHEMRGPLTPLLAGIQLIKLKERTHGPPALPHAMMERQLRHLMRLIEDLSDQSRLQLGKLHLEKGLVQLTEVVSQAVDAASSLIEQKSHTLSNQIQDESVWLDADPARLVQVFTNLIQNAAKYSPPCSLIELTFTCSAGEIQVNVQDNGDGIAPDKLHCVFELFTQLNPDSPSNSKGLGIGLALVKGLVEAHGGQVSAFSRGRGQGSCFTVKLPISAASHS